MEQEIHMHLLNYSDKVLFLSVANNIYLHLHKERVQL